MRVAALGSVLAFAVGCGTAGKRTAIGGVGGAAAGAGIGALIGGKKGALIGAGVGALTGGSVGLYLDKQAKELEEVAKTKRTENGILVELGSDLLFDTNSAALKPAAVEQLTKVGDIMAKYSDNRVRIEGHTDSTGSAALNQKLSDERAGAVRSLLLSRGVREAQMTAVGHGKTKPIADNATADGRAKNRRVELIIDVPNPT